MINKKLSIIIIVKNRHAHLKNVLVGLSRNENQLFETVIIHMNEECRVDYNFNLRHLHSYKLKTEEMLPLAKARNFGACKAKYENLVFLDVDCIPSPQMVSDYLKFFNEHQNAVAMGEVYYMRSSIENEWIEQDLKTASIKHQKRKYLQNCNAKHEKNYDKFWSLNFGLKRNTFEIIGGFSEKFEGYGAEDTDFSYKAKSKDINLYWAKGCTAYHQFHESQNPPLNHFDDIIRNATIFYSRWGVWPMAKWLKAFSEMDLIEWNTDATKINKLKNP